MSMFESDRYRWRETYFVLFRSEERPSLAEMERTLDAINPAYVLENTSADDEGRFSSLTLISAEDFAALDICYVDGEEVTEQIEALVEELRPAACEIGQQSQLDQVRTADARFDVLHFEQIPSDDDMPEDADPMDELLDPSALLLVMGALARLSGGVAVDPQGATILGGEGQG